MRGPAWDGVRRAARRVMPAIVVGLGLAAAGAQPAAAQFFGWGDGWAGGWGGGHWGGLRPSDIGRAIADQGFRVISPLRRNGSVFVADVVDRRGRRERLIVAAADAQILQRFYLDDPRLPGFVPRNRVARGSDESNWDNRSDVVPPASIPRSGRRQSLGATGDPDQGLDGSGRQGDGIGQDDGAEPQRIRPPQRTPKSRPRVVDRTPDATSAVPRDVPAALPARPQPKPSEATREPGGPASVNERPADTAPKVANKPPEPAAAAPSPAVGTPIATAPAPRMRDPLAIPGGEPKVAATKPAAPRPGSAAVEPTPRSAPVAKAAPAKTGDVPVAPLD